jgi:hypothetical protein
MHIIQEIKQLVWFVVKNLLLVAALLLWAAIAPGIRFLLPQVLIVRNPQGDFAWLCWVFVLATPFSVALWMAFLTHWHEIRLAQREGRLDAWREENGLLQRNIQATGFMFLGLFGSLACEFLFSFAFYHVVPYDMFEGASRYSLWFALFPFAAYAPVILLLIKRHYGPRLYWDDKLRCYSKFDPNDRSHLPSVTNAKFYPNMLKPVELPSEQESLSSISEHIERLRKANGIS